jgi:hypothetical protein
VTLRILSLAEADLLTGFGFMSDKPAVSAGIFSRR